VETSNLPINKYICWTMPTYNHIIQICLSSFAKMCLHYILKSQIIVIAQWKSNI